MVEDLRALFAALERRLSAAERTWGPPAEEEIAALEQDGVDVEEEEDLDEETISFWIDYPSGRETRRLQYYSVNDAANLLSIEFEAIRFLSDFDAVVHTDTGIVEARLGDLSAPSYLVSSGRLGTEIAAIPGVEHLDQLPLDAMQSFRHEEQETDSGEWRLRVTNGEKILEVSRISREFGFVRFGDTLSRFRDNEVTLKIEGIPTSTHDEALDLLKNTGRAFLFDLSLRYGLGVTLLERRVPRRRRQGRRNVESPPLYPQNRYADEPLSLYLYGRSADGLPLLEFLAYYQTIEYFFPTYARMELIEGLRRSLADPRFDSQNRADLARLADLASHGGSAAPERDQLRQTVRSCVSEDRIRSLIESSDQYHQHFCGKSQVIQGVEPVRLASKVDLLDQIAERVYAIRCRIVHTKSSDTDRDLDLLLPSSREARSLRPDIALVRDLAEQVLVASAAPLT